VRRRLAVGAAIAVAAAAGAWFVAASLQQDFAAYWIAGAARRLGLDPYLNHVAAAGPGADHRLWDGVAIFHHSRFLYPPLSADLFRPLAALSYAAAKGLFTAAMLAAWIGAGLLASEDRRGRTVYFVASALYFPLYRHLERGQIDLLLLLLLALAWRERERPLAAGAALAAAVAFKPALIGMLPVVWAGGRGRVVLATMGVAVALGGVTALVDGPARLHEYAGEVLPRASLYGEGGTDAQLDEKELPAEDDPGEVCIGRYCYELEIGEAPAVASWPGLLAPEAPTPASARLPFILGLGVLTAIAYSLRRPDDPYRQALLYWAAAIACVVTSPAGWVMGLVLALPLAPLVTRFWTERRLPPVPVAVAAAAWVALAMPQPFGGWAAVAGTVLLAAAVAIAVSARPAAVPT
jgi:hypothetical protein